MDVMQSAKLIREQRKKQQLTQQELADALGVTNKAVSKWETGRCFPDVALLEKLAECLHLPVTAFLQVEHGESIKQNTRWQRLWAEKFYMGKKESAKLMLLCLLMGCICSSICYGLGIFGAKDGLFMEILFSFLAENFIADIIIAGGVIAIVYVMRIQRKVQEDDIECASVFGMRMLLYSMLLLFSIIMYSFFKYVYVSASLFAFIAIFYFMTLFYVLVLEYKIRNTV